MADLDFVARARADFKDLFQKLDFLIKKFGEVAAVAQAANKLITFDQAIASQEALRSAIESTGKQLGKQRALLEKLQQIKANAQIDPKSGTLRGVVSQDVFPSTSKRGASVTENQLLQQIAKTKERINGYEAELNNLTRTQNGLLEQQKTALGVAGAQYDQILDKAASVVQGETIKGDLGQLYNRAAQEIADLQRLRGEVVAEVAKQPYGGRSLDLIDKIANKEGKLRGYQQEIASTQAKIASLKDSLVEAGISVDNLGQNAALSALTDRLGQLQESASTTKATLAQLKAERDRLLQAAGATDAITKIDEAIRALEQRQLSLIDPAIQNEFKEQYDGIANAIENQLNLLNRENATIEQQKAAISEIISLEQKRINLVKAEGEAMAKLNPYQGFNARDAISRGLNTVQRALFGLTDDFARRFVTTFQYATSAAMQFAVLRSIKEFGRIAIEAERAFADIATNLEFDIGADRGSAEFNAALEQVRQNVFRVANELNILPSVASKAAYVMVARFGDVTRAVQATRAQLLATQVSGIEQSEVLRALTAVAESFASAVFDTNSALTAQERLLARERQAVQLYGKALDYAVRIQQLYGIETEDSLEGVARSGETFKALGFSIEDTFAIIAATTRKLGGQGQQVAERLNRSLGQITSPEIAGALLQIARDSEYLNLTIKDFESGERALAALVDQYRQLEKIEPTTAQRILQELGQRRETEVIAAVLDTGDLQDQIKRDLAGAAGSAEERYRELAKTIKETFESINAQFETLSNNIANLGGLTPVRVLLKSFDTLLNVFNEILSGLNSIKQAFNQLAGANLGNILVDAATLAISLKSILRLVQYLGQTFPALGGIGLAAGNALNQINNANVGRFGNVKDIGGRLDIYTVAVDDAADATRGATSATKSMTSGFGRVAGALIGIVIAAAIVASVFNDLKRTQEEAKLVTDDLTANFRDLQKQIAAGDITRAEGVIADYQGKFDRFDTAGTEWGFFTDKLSKAFPSLFANFFLDAAEKANYDQAVAEYERLAATGAGETGTFIDLFRRPPELDIANFKEGTKGFYAAAAQDLIKGYADSLYAGLTESVNELYKLDPDDFSDGPGSDIGNILRQAQSILLQLNYGIITDPEKRRELVEELNQLYEETVLLILRKESEQLEVEGTADSILTESERIFSSYELGAVSFKDLNVTLNKNLDELLRLYAEVGNQPVRFEVLERIKSQIEIANRAIEDNLEARIDLLNAVGDSPLSVGQSGAFELQNEISSLEKAIAQITAGGVNEFERAALGELLVRLNRAKIELVRTTNEEAVEIARSQVSLARTDSEYIAAVKNLINEYEQQFRDYALRLENFGATLQIFGGAAAAQLLAALADARQRTNRAQEELQRAADDRLFESGVALKRIQAIRKFNPLDPMAEIEGELAEIYAERSRAFQNEAERLENLRREAVAIANKNQLLLRIWSAQVLAQVKVGDSLTRLKAQITIANKEIERVIRDVGKNSEEYWNAVNNYNDLLNSLYEQELALKNYRRLLGLTDITSSYQLAAAELQYIVDQLANPNIGELERAQLELERRRAEIAKEQARFDSELLNAQFMFESGQISEEAYLQFLRNLLSQVDTATEDGKNLWIQINNLIQGMEEDVSDLAFNIPDQIRLPTLFEIRRAVEADQLGVNYLDNREQEINLYVSNNVELEEVLKAMDSIYGSNITTQSKRYAPGDARISIGKTWL